MPILTHNYAMKPQCTLTILTKLRYVVLHAFDTHSRLNWAVWLTTSDDSTQPYTRQQYWRRV